MKKIIKMLMLLCGLAVICFSIWESIKIYKKPTTEWHHCKSNNECTPDYACDSRPLNKAFQKRAMAFNEFLGPLMRIACYERLPGEPREAFCRKETCVDDSFDDWKVCNNDEDCVLVKRMCGEESYHKKYEDKARKAIENMEADLMPDCRDANKKSGQRRLKCITNKCAIVYE